MILFFCKLILLKGIPLIWYDFIFLQIDIFEVDTIKMVRCYFLQITIVKKTTINMVYTFL